jgi:ABC transporter transmembrane region
MYSMMAANDIKKDAILDANVIATEAISNIRTVASYINETKMVQKFVAELIKPKEKAIRYSVFLGLLTGAGQFAILGANALCMLHRWYGWPFTNIILAFWYGGKLIRDSSLDFEQFLVTYQVQIVLF